jgi:hypothetical protein
MRRERYMYRIYMSYKERKEKKSPATPDPRPVSSREFEAQTERPFPSMCIKLLFLMF